MDYATRQAVQRRMSESSDQRSLTSALASHGLRHEPAEHGNRRIIDAATGELVDVCGAIGGWALVYAREAAIPSTTSTKAA